MNYSRNIKTDTAVDWLAMLGALENPIKGLVVHTCCWFCRKVDTLPAWYLRYYVYRPIDKFLNVNAVSLKGMPRSYRKRRDSSEAKEEPDHDQVKHEVEVSKKLEEAKEIQKFRKRHVGVSAVGLAFGKKFTEEENVTPDPFNLKAGGLVDLKEIQAAEAEKAEDEVLQRLANTFSAETKQRDDNTHMLKYIENEMSKQNAEESEEQQSSTYEAKIKSLYKLPERINFKEKSKTEEMLSNQMLSGIPEVDLGIDAKFRNIEETELAKQKLVEDRMAKEQERPSMVPTNMATNYTLHSLRFFKNDRGQQSKEVMKDKAKQEDKSAPPAYIPVVGESEPELKQVGQTDSHKRKAEHTQLATDDYHYDKFKKRTRRF